MLEEIIDSIRGLFAEAGVSKMPPEIIVNFPPGSAAEGAEAGRFHLQRGTDGSFAYAWHPTSRVVDLQPERADFVIGHIFDALSSLVSFLKSFPGAQLFISGKAFEPKVIKAYVDALRPERGLASFLCDRHPAWLRWAFGAGQGIQKDLGHVELADLLLDNAEDLDEPMIAKVLAQFRAARSVEHVADHDTGSAMGVRVNWKGGAGNADGSKATDVQVPREFTAKIPAFVGAWESGEEPSFAAKFRLRVIPPRSGDDAPKFRLLWVNAREYEMTASAAVEQAVIEAVGGTAPVFLGAPNSQRFVPVRG